MVIVPVEILPSETYKEIVELTKDCLPSGSIEDSELTDEGHGYYLFSCNVVDFYDQMLKDFMCIIDKKTFKIVYNKCNFNDTVAEYENWLTSQLVGSDLNSILDL